ncbi:hypothetical protein BKM20_26185 [Pseudomonas avellanae]|uniref:Amino acid permease/ SLC12A domain-containing protein n=1 Tax=Pseudomonas avellanae pv. morsprunorum TaxID=3380385 RepID=A0ABX4YR03_9PSED|nr:hypothetical protein AL055_23020 [Pseudomonas amygdali pv. morsprunorum]POC82808.1 hypothetical protein BKM26_25975 [Pseudomonas avellanae]SPF11186.1 putative membrane protein [Pseudomonas syringae group genomosp. 3]POD00332.1 hypothetical protein BKM20_26185 [Pseudomonas avellanae]POD14537.1 hypothetical protein BKM05_26370 [Pseudomonas avellanae]
MQRKRHSRDAITGSGRELKRRLTNRHIQLIAISGAIGTGLFMGSGKMIALSGSSILLVYAIMGLFVFFIMRAMGEMLLANLDMGSFADLVHHHLVCRLKINFSHACVLIAARARCILFKISSPLAFQT